MGGVDLCPTPSIIFYVGSKIKGKQNNTNLLLHLPSFILKSGVHRWDLITKLLNFSLFPYFSSFFQGKNFSLMTTYIAQWVTWRLENKREILHHDDSSGWSLKVKRPLKTYSGMLYFITERQILKWVKLYNGDFFSPPDLPFFLVGMRNSGSCDGIRLTRNYHLFVG